MVSLRPGGSQLGGARPSPEVDARTGIWKACRPARSLIGTLPTTPTRKIVDGLVAALDDAHRDRLIDTDRRKSHTASFSENG